MDLLAAAYRSESEDEKYQEQDNDNDRDAAAVPSSSSHALVSINAAPAINTEAYAQPRYISATTSVLYHNPTVDELYRPILGPQPASSSSSSSSSVLTAAGVLPNHILGYVEKTAINEGIFDGQYHQFISKGVTVDPAATQLTNTKLVVDQRKRGYLNNTEIQEQGETKDHMQEEWRQKKKQHSDPSDPDSFLGPWMPRDEHQRKEHQSQQPTEEQLKNREEALAKKQKQIKDAHNNAITEETSTFYGQELYDYQHRSYISPPSQIKPIDWLNTRNVADPPRCYVPKTLVHTWHGHKKGVNAIRFFPHTGHLLLSASMDKSIRIWNVGGDYRCLRSYHGHAEAVRDICFNHDGTRFLSASYDAYIKLWDTETGACISRHTTGKIPFCARLHPAPEHEHECLVGQNNKLIVQWDLRSNTVITEYNEHLATVNSVTFIDEDRRFVSTSDDKKVFVWEYGLPVVIKHISEPDMHSIPSVTVHPTGKFFLGQSQDNQILIFTAQNKYKIKRNKRFIGHRVAGYACQIGVSNDGAWVMSGDGEGRLFVWDWKTGKIVKKMKCHDQVTIGCAWNPVETSKVATCSWDGTIKYWD